MREEKNGQKTVFRLTPNVKYMLCYLLTWISGIIFLVLEKDDRETRFHAMQSVILFGGLSIISSVMDFLHIFKSYIWIISLGSFVLWIIMLIRTYKGEKVILPIVGKFAEKQNNRM